MTLPRSITNAGGWSLFLRTFLSCSSRRTKGSRRTELFVRFPCRLGARLESQSIRSLAFCIGLIPVASAQTPDQEQPVEQKLPPVRCTIAPTKDAVRWQSTQVSPGTPVSEKDKSTQGIESQTQNSSSHLAILNASSLSRDSSCGIPN